MRGFLCIISSSPLRFGDCRSGTAYYSAVRGRLPISRCSYVYLEPGSTLFSCGDVVRWKEQTGVMEVTRAKLASKRAKDEEGRKPCLSTLQYLRRNLMTQRDKSYFSCSRS